MIGSKGFRLLVLLFNTTSKTLGIISAALNILTKSPTLISLSITYCALCNVAEEIIEPANFTGSNDAT
jgi:hypothetical protein